jgi:hypothetical protein
MSCYGETNVKILIIIIFLYTIVCLVGEQLQQYPGWPRSDALVFLLSLSQIYAIIINHKKHENLHQHRLTGSITISTSFGESLITRGHACIWGWMRPKHIGWVRNVLLAHQYEALGFRVLETRENQPNYTEDPRYSHESILNSVYLTIQQTQSTHMTAYQTVSRANGGMRWDPERSAEQRVFLAVSAHLWRGVYHWHVEDNCMRPIPVASVHGQSNQWFGWTAKGGGRAKSSYQGSPVYIQGDHVWFLHISTSYQEFQSSTLSRNPSTIKLGLHPLNNPKTEFILSVGVLDQQPTKGSTRGRWMWPRWDR